MIFYKCLKDKAMNIENKPIFISLSPKNNNKPKKTILDANTRMVFLFYDKIGKKEVNLSTTHQ